MYGVETAGLRDIVLFADDDPALCQLWAYVLGENRLQVTLATTGEDALAAAVAKRPKIAILDMWMPRMSGLAVCKRIKNDEVLKDMMIVIMTGDDDEGVREKVAAAGADQFLLKPADDDELLLLIRETAGVQPKLSVVATTA